MSDQGAAPHHDDLASGPVADSGAPDDDLPALVATGERYVRLGLLGVGGMGRVYLARDRWLGRHVALKEALDDRLVRRLSREVRVTAGLEHPGIVTVYDEGRGADGRVFYTMRLMRGRPLAQRIRECNDLRARLGLVRHYLDACQAVAYAHAQGVVHRDLKPANVMLGAFGETQVVDWGLARRLADPADDPPGAVVGTPAYMSPEQARGAPADPRCDVWSLGVVLRELLDVAADGPAELAAIVARATAAAPADRYADAGALAADVAAWLDGRRVDAHRYTALEIGLRFVRAWRVPLIVAGAALVLLAVVLVLATLRLQAQRDRAVAAEHDVRRALGESDRNLAAALVAQARAAAGQDARAVAEVLAAHALRLVDTPEARGLLAGTRAAARPIRLASAALPACHPLVALAVDDILCGVDTELVRVVAGAPRWRVATGHPIKELRVDAGRVWAVAFGYTATTVDLATGVLDDANWEIIDYNVGDAWPVRSVALPGAAQHLVAETCGGGLIGIAGAIDGVHVRLCADGEVGRGDDLGDVALAPAFGPSDFVTFTHLALAPDAASIVVAGTHGRVGVHDFATRASRTVAPARPDSVRRLAVGPDGDRVAVARERGGVDLYSLPDLHHLATIPATDVRYLRVQRDGSLLVADADIATLWAPPALTRPDTFTDEHGVTGVAFSADGDVLLSTHGEGRVVVWDRATGVRRHTLTLGRGTVKAGAFFRDGRRFVVVQSDRGPRGPQVFDVATGAVLPFTSDTPDPPPISRRVVTLADDRILTATYGAALYSTALDRRVPAVDCPRVEWLDLATDPSRTHIAAVAVDGVVHVADLDLRCRPIPGPAGAFTADIGDDGRTVVVGAARALARVDGDVLRWQVDHPGVRPLDVALAPDLRLVASAGPDDAARLWDADTGALRAVLTGHDARVAVVEFSPDGRHVATGSWDGRVRLWDLATLDDAADALVVDAERTWGLGLADALARH